MSVSRDHEVEEERTREDPREVEALEACKDVETGQLVGAQCPAEEEARGEHVEEAEDERARDDRRVRAARDHAMHEDDADGVAGPRG